MRDIKFRALFKHILTDKTVWYDIVVNYSLKNIEGYVQVSPWLQYTGLKDKEGKEIYEGDFLPIYFQNFMDLSNSKSYGQVVFIKGIFVLKFNHPEHGIVYDPLHNRNHDRAIAGNIHDNPQLISKILEE